MKTATNPQTGKRVYWDGEQWLPLKTATNKQTGEVIGIVEGETFTVTPPRPREPESMREMIRETPERFQETRERYRSTLAGDVERLPGKFRVGTTLAAGVGAAGETLGEVAGEAYRRYTPEAVQRGVSEAYEGSMLQRGMEKVGELAQAYPEEATTAEALLNIAGAGPKMALPSIPRPSASVRMASGRATQAVLEEERKAVADSLLPEDYVKAPGTVEPTGAMNRNVYVPSPSEDNVIDYLAKLPEYKGDRNPAVNAKVVDGQLAKHEADLQSYIKRSKNPKTDVADLSSTLEELKAGFHDLDDYVELMPDAQKKVDLLIDTAVKRLNEKASKGGKITARDILEVRRQLDKQIFRKKPTAGLENPDLASAKEVAGKYVRDELNQAFLKLMPDDEAYRLINGMAMLFRAKNLLDVKAGKAINQTMLGRTVKGIEDFSGLRFPTTPLALGATAAAGTAAVGGMPVVAAVAAGTGVGVGLARLSRKRRRAEILRELIKSTDKMIQGANVTAETMATLRADKVMLAQMLNEVNQEPENEQ
jgi:hypothetical protein